MMRWLALRWTVKEDNKQPDLVHAGPVVVLLDLPERPAVQIISRTGASTGMCTRKNSPPT